MALRLLLLACLAAQQLTGASLTLADLPARNASILADPDTRTYYLYVSAEAPAASVPAASLKVYRSKDLASWEGPATACQVPGSGWASTSQAVIDLKVLAYRGKYYLFATLSNPDTVIAKPPASWRLNTLQGTQIFASQSPQGPFAPIPNSTAKPYTGDDLVALGGSLYVEGDLAWLIYVHDWTQMVDANIEAVRLRADLSAPVDDAIYLFKASDAPWWGPGQQKTTSREPRYYPAAAPSAYRTRSGSLVMIWSSPKDGKPALILARSVTGKLGGPWKQIATLLGDAAQATVFHAFDGRLMMLTGPNPKFVELEDTGDTFRIKRPGGTAK